MKVISSIFVLVLLYLVSHSAQTHVFRTVPETSPPTEWKQAWDYVYVRSNAYMFWWLYYSAAPRGYENSPLIIWLQGGPGGSSTGFGNFKELGPLDVNLKLRNTTWVMHASVLFIDNPVGTGYSYVTDDSAYTTNNSQIATDLLTTLSQFLNKHSEFKKIPLYIFSESYGGKMAAGFSQLLLQEIQSGSVECNFKGVALGDSWISPIDSVLSWAPYLYASSLIDEVGLREIGAMASKTKNALDKQHYAEATELWGQTESVVEQYAGNVNMYNILRWGESDVDFARYRAILKQDKVLIEKYRSNDDLDVLMNGPIKKSLGIIPDSVTWGGQSANVFAYLAGDFMKPVVDVVGDLLESNAIDVVVYSGQLDLIVDTLGTEAWVQQLKWKDLECYNNATRVVLKIQEFDENVAGFYKNCKRFTFYWIMNAGHMIPSDAGEAAVKMLRNIIEH